MILRRELVARVSFAALLAMVIFWTGPNLDVATAGGSAGGEATKQISYLCIFAIALVSSGVLQSAKEALVIPVSVMLVLAWCWLSISWAIEPSTGLRRVILTSIIIWILFSNIHTAGYRGARDTLRWVLAFSLLVDFAAVALLPRAIHQFTNSGAEQLIGDWRGWFPHKNNAGAVCAITIIIFWFDAKDMKRWLRIPILVGAAFFLMKTNSKTSMALLLPAILAGTLYLRYNYRHKVVVGLSLLLAIVVLSFLGYVYSDIVAAPFEDENAFTGRNQIWPVLLTYASDHLLLGSGYGSFWNIKGGSPIDSYLLQSSWIHTVGNGHNGYLDLLVQLGLPGLILVVVALVVVPTVKMILINIKDRPSAAMVMALLVFCFGHNLTESSLLDRDASMNVFFMISLAFLQGCIRMSRPLPVARHDLVYPAFGPAINLRGHGRS